MKCRFKIKKSRTIKVKNSLKLLIQKRFLPSILRKKGKLLDENTFFLKKPYKNTKNFYKSILHFLMIYFFRRKTIYIR